MLAQLHQAPPQSHPGQAGSTSSCPAAATSRRRSLSSIRRGSGAALRAGTKRIRPVRCRHHRAARPVRPPPRPSRQPQRELVVTHGEPHAGNVMRRSDGRHLLVDWDTVAVAPPERDLWMHMDTATTTPRATQPQPVTGPTAAPWTSSVSPGTSATSPPSPRSSDPHTGRTKTPQRPTTACRHASPCAPAGRAYSPSCNPTAGARVTTRVFEARTSRAHACRRTCLRYRPERRS